MSLLEEIKEKYPKGFHRIDINEFELIRRAYKGKVMSPKAVSQELGVSLEKIEEQAREGKLHYFSLGKGYAFVPVEDVYQWKIDMGELNPEIKFET